MLVTKNGDEKGYWIKEEKRSIFIEVLRSGSYELTMINKALCYMNLASNISSLWDEAITCLNSQVSGPNENAESVNFFLGNTTEQ